MRYFFILGNHPELSLAEIFALLKATTFEVVEVCSAALIVEAESLDPAALMERLGGTIKIGVIPEGPVTMAAANLRDFMAAAIQQRGGGEGKLTYGMSVYGIEGGERKATAAAGAFRDVGMEIKRELKESGRSARLVRAQTGPTLTSVVVTKEGLTKDGFEFVVFVKGTEMYLGTTSVVQPFEEFSQIDYGRPSRDTIQGMLPPKLARLMINLAGVPGDATLMDPFCGSGTVLTEALRLGFRRLYGSDKNPAAVESTTKNIAWLSEKIPATKNAEIKLATADARALSAAVPAGSIDAVVTEPFLGPPRSGREKRGDIQRDLGELSKLYYESLSSWRTLLKNGALVVMILPVNIIGQEKHGMSAADFAKLGYTTESLLPTAIFTRLYSKETKNRGLMYGRGDQHVWREVIRLRLKK